MRHNRSELNDSMHHMNRIESPICNNCNSNVPETNQHALIDCIKHNEIRTKYIQVINSIMRCNKLSIDMILWTDKWNVVRDKQMRLKTITGQYIIDIMKNRLEYIPFNPSI